MIIVLYKCSDPNNKVVKMPIGGNEFDGVLKKETSIIHPTIIVATPNPTTFNYLYIPEFRRYYFIKNITSLKENLWQIDCDVDVLMSFRNEIKNQNAIINKNSQMYDAYLNDGSYVNSCKTQIQTINYNTGFSDTASYVLVTAGS